MKKALLVIAVLMAGLFYAVATNYEMIGVNNSDGFVLDNNKIQTNVFSGNVDENVEAKQVFAAEGIYKRLSTVYYGDENKIKVNFSYPMYINNGAAIKLLSGQESLITNSFEFIDAYSNLILNDGLAFNTTFERADFNDYILVHLSNNLYVNTKDIRIETFLNTYKIPVNSIIYFSTERISYYTLKGDSTFMGNTISDVGDGTYITIGDVDILYNEFLLKLGETVQYHQSEQKQNAQEIEEDVEGQEEIPGNKEHKEKKTKSSGSKGDEGSTSDEDNNLIDEGENGAGGQEKPEAAAEPITQVAPEKPEKNEAAEKPELPEETPASPIPPDPYIIIHPDWELPEVKMGDRFAEGVYSLDMTVDIKDYAGVIYGGLVFEVFNQDALTNKETISKVYEEGVFKDNKTYRQGSSIKIIGSEDINGLIYYKAINDTYGYEYFFASDIKLQVVKRSTFLAPSGEDIEILLTGLVPETDYLVSGYFKCKDAYDRPYEYVDKYGITHTQIDFLSPRGFKTKAVTDLGDIIFAEFDTGNIFGDQLQVNDVGFATNSDKDAIASLTRIQYKITKDSETVAANILPSKQLASLLQLQKIAFIYRTNIKSNSNYKIEFTCFDMYGNELVVKNNTVDVKTCKKLPISKITIDYNKDDQGKEILGQIKLSASFENPDSVAYENLRFIIIKSDGEVYKYYDESSGTYLDYIPCIPDKVYDLDGFDLDSKYTVKLICECDNDDSQGFITREIAIREFTTANISLLGPLYLNVSNISKDRCPDERYRRAVISVSLSNATNSQLPEFVDHLSITLTSDAGVTFYTFSEEDLQTLFVDKEVVEIDTDYLEPPGLVGNTRYSISFNSIHDFDDGTTYIISTNPSLKQVTTIRTPVEVLMTSPVTAPGYINTSVLINDVDDVIVGDTALLKIYEMDGDKYSLAASFLIEKNAKEYKQIILSSDSSLSTDGISYTIKQDATYRFIYQAEEANTETGAINDYVLAQKDVYIDTGVKGRIYLKSLHENFSCFQQIEYIESHGKEYINTGVVPSKYTEFEISFFYDQSISSSASASGYGVIFGTRESSSSYTFISSGYSSKNTGYFGYGNNTRIAGNIKAHNYNELSLKDSVYTANGVSQIISMIDYPNNFYPIYIFNLNQKNAPTSEYCYGKLYKFKIWDNKVLMRDFVPCYRKSDHVYGLYDLVNGEFYENKGKGAFAGGDPIGPVDPTIKETNTAEIAINLTYPDNWVGNKDFYVDVKNDSDTSYKDTITFTYDKSLSTLTNRIYHASNIVDGVLETSDVTLAYDTNTNSYKGTFDYSVNKIDDKNKKYTFDLYTILMDNIYLNNSEAIPDETSKQELIDDKFKEDIDLTIAYPMSDIEDYSFYIDVFNEEVSTDRVYETLYFKHVSSIENKLNYELYKTSDLSTKLQDVELSKDESILGSNTYKGKIKEIVFDKISDPTKSYRFTIYRKVLNDLLYVPLDSTSFSTEQMIYTISNIDEFFAIKTNNRKYVVIDDIEYIDTSIHSNTGGKWGSTSFNAQVDFQGFSLTYKGYNNLIYKLSETTEISNMVYKTTANLIKNTTLTQQGNNNRGAGSFVSENYGKLSNISIEYSEVQPEDIANEGSPLYRGSYYWSDDPNHASSTGKKYSYLHTQSALTIQNYGVIENFVVDVKTPISTGFRSSMICADNYGTIRNGYVYSSTGTDYKATANVYRNSSYSSDLKNHNEFGFITTRNMPSGIYVGITENVYALGNITNYTGTTDEALGIITGYNTSIVRNTFSNGNVLKGNTINESSYGPTLGYTTSTVNRNPNNNYMSTYSYNNSYNLPTSTIALRSKSWVNDVLNTNNYHEFNVDEMISVGCYPQVSLTDVMPSQPLLELPKLPSKDEVDVLFTETYTLGEVGNEDIDRLINERRSGNEIGDLIYGVKEGSPYTSNSQIVKAYVSDKSASQIHSFALSDSTMFNNVLLQTMDGTGISVCYLEVYNPSEALSKYHMTGLYFKDYAGDKVYPPYSISRDMEVSYVKLITEVSEWRSVIENPKQNHRLGADLDFTGIPMKDIFVNADFSGTLDGLNHTIRNIEYDSKAFSSIFPQGTDGSNSANIGLLKTLTGKVRNLTLENVHFEGGENVGILAGTTNGAVIDNVYIKNSYAAGTNRVGGIASSIAYSDISNVGVSNTKLISVGGKYNTANDNWKCGVGGISAYVLDANNIERTFVNNIYIESFDDAFEYPSVGGLLGYINGNGNKLNGCYATGTINSNAYASGGLIGMNYTSFEMNYCYSDVDVNSYFYNAGGIVGLEYANIVSETPILSFGDVHSATILEDDGRVNAFKILGNNYRLFNSTTYTLNGMFYDKTTLLSNTALTKSGESFSVDYLNSLEGRDTLGAYFKREIDLIDDSTSLKGYLPKLVDLEGNLLPNQSNNYISGFDGNIKVSIDDSIANKVVINITHPDTIKIDDIYTDYTYINSLIDIDNRNNFYGVKSLTNRNALSYQLDKSSTSTGTIFTMNSITPDSYYDYYNVTALRYTNQDNEVGYIRLNHRLNNISQQFKSIKTLSDYDRYVSPSIAENFKLEGDINFNDITANYYDEKYTNLVINRLIGTKGGDSNYLDLKDNKKAKPYYKISNLNINGLTDTNQEHGYIYQYESNLFKVILSDVSNITFEDIKVNGRNKVTIIGKNQSLVHNISFIDCDISNTNNQYNGHAMIGISFGEVSNVFINSCDVLTKSYYAGILSGFVYTNFYGTDIRNVYIDNSSSSGIRECGSLAGALGEDYPFYKRTANIENVIINNNKINTTGTYCGGIIGRTYTYTYASLKNCNVENSEISSTSYYVGGVLGCNSANDNIAINDCYVYNSTVKSTYTSDCYVGGIVGYQSGNIHNTTVEDSLIVGSGNRIGGITGYNNYSVSRTGDAISRKTFLDSEDQDLFGYVLNTKVYGKNYVGGIAGYSNANITRAIVDKSEIKGNEYLGGISGVCYNYYTSQSIVANTSITPWRDSKEATYGPAFSSTQQYVGGILGATGRIVTSIVDSCFIGGENANYVGGLQGIGRLYTSGTNTSNSSIENTVVVGKNYVGGVFGTLSCNSDSQKYANITNVYSNAYIYGDDYVGGISGNVNGHPNKDSKTQEVLSYSPMPISENVYFTGSITSKNSAGALYGRIVGNTETINNCFRYVSSFPSFIKANKISPLFSDYNGSAFAYNWNNLINDTSSLGISLRSDTKLYLTDTDGKVVTQTTMKDLVENISTYADYIANDIDLEEGYIKYVDTQEIVKENFTKNIAGDPFISMYSSIDEYKTKFYDYSLLDTRTESKVGESYRYIKPRNMSEIDYMPMNYTNTQNDSYKTKQYLIYYNEDINGALIGNRYHTIKNPFVDESKAYKSINVQQGIGIPGTDKDISDNNYMNNIHDLYITGGLYATGIGVEDASKKDSNTDFEPTYRNLPVDYQQIEYIESHGKEYINTGVVPSKYTEFEISFFYDQSISSSASASGYGVIFGTRESSSSYTFISSGYSSKNTGYFGYGNNTRIAGNIKAHNYNELSLKDSVYTANGVSQIISMIDYPNNFYPIYIFNLNQKNAPTSEYCYGKLYKFKIWDNKVLMRDFVPCYRKSDHVYGLYDLVNGEFYENKGKGAFTGGLDVDKEEAQQKDFLRAMYTYPSSIFSINLEPNPGFLSLLEDLDASAYLTLYGEGSSKLIDSYQITPSTKTVSISYDFRDIAKIEVKVDKDDYHLLISINDLTSAVKNEVSLYGEHVFYIGSDNKLYNELGLYDEYHIYTHLYKDEIVDNEGNIYSLENLITPIGSVPSIEVLPNPIPLYELDFNGKHVKTYGSYSIIDDKLSNTYRIFKASGNLIAIDNNTNPVADPLYAKYKDGKSTILMLSKDNKVYSIGTNSILDNLQSFTNENIVNISTNLHNKVNDNNKLVGFVYANGDVAIYNIETGRRVTSPLTSPSLKSKSLGDFLSNTLSLDNIFSFSKPSEELSSDKNTADKVANLLTSTGLSLNDVVDYAAEDGSNLVTIVNSANNKDTKKLMLNRTNSSKDGTNSMDSTGALPTNDNVSNFDAPIDGETNKDVNTNKDININIEQELDNNKSIDSSIKDNSNSPKSKIVINNPDNKDINITIEKANSNEEIDETNQIVSPITPEVEESIPTPSSPIKQEVEKTEDTEVNNESHLVTDKTNSSVEEYITVYNGESKEFEILDVNELLENPEEVKSENTKVVDRSTLKALYNALGESKDDTTRRGITIYSIIAGIIILLLIPVIVLRNKVNRKH